MDFKHNKSLGQNFLRDTNLLRAIVSDSGVNKDDTAIEVGAGMGALTRELSRAAGRVISYEIDHRLENTLRSEFDGSNVTLIFADILQQNPSEVSRLAGDSYVLVANLPYYITTPVLFYFVEKVKGLRSATIMVQKEVADRLTAPANSKDYGAVTATLGLEFDIKTTRNVSRKLFDPAPSVDSAVVRLDRRDTITPQLRAFVRSAFAMRRKTLVNNLASTYPKQEITSTLTQLNLSPTTRAEALPPETLRTLHDRLSNLKNPT